MVYKVFIQYCPFKQSTKPPVAPLRTGRKAKTLLLYLFAINAFSFPTKQGKSFFIINMAKQ